MGLTAPKCTGHYSERFRHLYHHPSQRPHAQTRRTVWEKVNDGYEVLEIPKGLWTEAIFAKEKPETETPKVKLDNMGTLDNMDDSDDAQEEDDNYPEEREKDTDDDDDDAFDEDKLTEESYRTTFDENPEDLNLEAEDIVDDEVY